jgi:protein-tyrosine-phosphatase
MPSILFVCTANQIRSPFAAAYFEKLLIENRVNDGTWRIDSAGTWALPGLPVDMQLKSLEQRWGLDFSRHRTQQVDENKLDAYDLVLVMEKGQREALFYEFPQFSEKIMLLTNFSAPTFDINDPRGLGGKEYEKCLEEISRILSVTFGQIIKEAINDQPG